MIDLHSRMEVSWSTQPHLQASLVTDDLLMGYFRKNRRQG
jgi:hypothetical protein